MKRRECDRLWEIDAAREGRLSAKDMDAWARHLRICAECSATAMENERIRQAAASWMASEPEELELRRLRVRVLADAARTPARSNRRWAAIVVTAVVAVVAAFATIHMASTGPAASRESAEEASFASTVSVPAAARWSRARENGVERVRLEDGTLRVHVRHQRAGERFLVTLPDGELEVRGTTFVVTASGGATARVEVEEGVVAVRVGGAPEVVLGPGAVWEAPARVVAGTGTTPANANGLTAAAAPAPTTALAPLTAAALVPAGSPSSVRSTRVPAGKRDTAVRAARAATDDTSENAADESYAAAVASMQRGEYGAAANALHDFVAAHPRAPQAEDASYLEAVALARSGRGDAAGLAAERHLAQFPQSFHRREAAFLAARAARDRGDCSAARALVAPWPGSQDARALLDAKACSSP